MAKAQDSLVTLQQISTKIETGVSNLTQVVGLFDTLADRLKELTVNIKQKEEEIESLDVKFKETFRAKQVALDLDVKENAEKTALAILSSQNKTAILNTELKVLQDRITSLEKEMQNEISKQVAITTNSQKREYEAAIKLMEANTLAEKAEQKYQIESLSKQNAALQQEVASWKQQLDNERAASIERAKAASIGTLTVNSTK